MTATASVAHTPAPSTVTVYMAGPSLTTRGGITSVEKIILAHCPPGFRIRHIPTYGSCHFANNALMFAGAFLRLLGALICNRAALVHVHFAERGSVIRKTMLAALVLLFRKPLILHSHGAAYKEFHAEIPGAAKWILRRILGRCTRFIALSQNWCEFYESALGLRQGQAVVMPNPVANFPTPSGNGHKRDTVNLIFMGHIGGRGGIMDRLGPFRCRVRQDKGAFDLIRAFAALPSAARERSRLVMAGSGETDVARKLVRQLGVAEEVEIKEWLDDTARDRLLEEADVFVLPSYHEGLPMALLETMAHGIPPIITPVGGIPEVVRHNGNGLLVAPGNQAELVEAMQSLVMDGHLRCRLGDAARESMRKHNVDDYMTKLCRLYQDALQAKPDGGK